LTLPVRYLLSAIGVAVVRLYDDWQRGRERTAPEDKLESLTRRMTAIRLSAALDAALTRHAVK